MRMGWLNAAVPGWRGGFGGDGRRLGARIPRRVVPPRLGPEAMHLTARQLDQ